MTIIGKYLEDRILYSEEVVLYDLPRSFEIRRKGGFVMKEHFLYICMVVEGDKVDILTEVSKEEQWDNS
jgi:hypothetical protein